MYECPICKEVPNSHSLKVLEELDGIVYLYTCPSKAIRYDDREGINAHYRGVLHELGEKKWIWIFDARGFSIKHYLQFRITKDLADILSEYSGTLNEIQIYNTNRFIKMTYTMVYPFLNERIRDVVKFYS